MSILASAQHQLVATFESLIERSRILEAREAWFYDQKNKQQANPASAKAPPQCVIEEQKQQREEQRQQWQEELDRLKWQIDSLRAAEKEGEPH